MGGKPVSARRNLPQKRAAYAHFQGWRWRWCWQGATTLESKPCVLIFEGRGGEGVGRSNHPQKQAMRLIFKGGSGGGVGKQQLPSKTSLDAHFQR